MSPSRGRPVTAPVKKLVALTDDIVGGIDRWRGEQAPPMNQSEAIRVLLRDWLVSHGYLKPDK